MPMEEKVLNSMKPIWVRPQSEVTQEEYKDFYRHISHDFAEPLAWSHNKVEGKLEYTSLLYVPGRAPFDLYHREAPKGLKLYVIDAYKVAGATGMGVRINTIMQTCFFALSGVLPRQEAIARIQESIGAS